MKNFCFIVAMLMMMACNNLHSNQNKKSDKESEGNLSKDELWKQFMRVSLSTMEKMPPDSNCFLILNHREVSFYKKNSLEFRSGLSEYLKNDSLIVYRLISQPDIQIGYNRKDSVLLLTRNHPEGGTPTGNLEYFARKVQEASPFNK
jgi:hypothetical protein